MTDKDQQLQQFREAVDRKAEAAEAGNPSRTGPPPAEEGDPGRPNDTDPREKSSRKGQVTADKWNQ